MLNLHMVPQPSKELQGLDNIINDHRWHTLNRVFLWEELKIMDFLKSFEGLHEIVRMLKIHRYQKWLEDMKQRYELMLEASIYTEDVCLSWS